MTQTRLFTAEEALEIKQQLKLPADTLRATQQWFIRAVKRPDSKQQVQLGVHFEEIGEMLAAMQGVDEDTQIRLMVLQGALHSLATALKTGTASVRVSDPKEFFDALCDQVVTATGVGFTQGMDIPSGLDRVNLSNYSKFDADGNALFDATGKIAKGPNYHKPDFTGLY